MVIIVCLTHRTRVTASMDEDLPRPAAKPRTAPARAWIGRGVQLAAAAVLVAGLAQLLPGGLLAETSAGAAVQNAMRAVARAIGTVSACRLTLKTW